MISFIFSAVIVICHLVAAAYAIDALSSENAHPGLYPYIWEWCLGFGILSVISLISSDLQNCISTLFEENKYSFNCLGLYFVLNYLGVQAASAEASWTPIYLVNVFYWLLGFSLFYLVLGTFDFLWNHR